MAPRRRGWDLMLVVGGFGVVILFSQIFLFAATSDGRVQRTQLISDLQGDFTETLDNGDMFGAGVEGIGDLDGDSIEDLAIGAIFDDDAVNRGAVYILFMNMNGTVRASQKISSTAGGFSGTTTGLGEFGVNIEKLGDLDGDLVTDIAVSEHKGNDGGTDRGAVWILFLNTDGTVKASQEISSTTGGFGGTLEDSDQFGFGLERTRDFNADSREDLAVGAVLDDDGGTDRGAVWILHMNTNGTVASQSKISSSTGGLPAVLDDGDRFGAGITQIDDLNGDNVSELVVGAPRDDDGGTDRGAVYVLFMNTDGTVASSQKISSTTGNFAGTLDDSDFFGHDVTSLGDVNRDGNYDILVTAYQDDDGASNAGAFWILFLNADGTVRSHQKISNAEGLFPSGALVNQDNFGQQASLIGDLDNNGVPDVISGVWNDDDGGGDRGGAWVVFLRDASSIKHGKTFPRNTSIAVVGGTTCTATRNVTIELSAQDAAYVVTGTDAYFIDNGWASFTPPSMTQEIILPEADGDYVIHALFRSGDDNLSVPQDAPIRLDQEGGCL